ALYRPYHLIGLELGISVASAALRGEPTGAPRSFGADVVATAKRDLAPGETLDGEGGYMVYGTLVPAHSSLERGSLPIGLAHGVEVTRPVAAGTMLESADVRLDEREEATGVRAELERTFASSG
nr:flagellar biosynthesis protein FlgA [Thermoleophilaceae bacterium]